MQPRAEDFESHESLCCRAKSKVKDDELLEELLQVPTPGPQETLEEDRALFSQMPYRPADDKLLEELLFASSQDFQGAACDDSKSAVAKASSSRAEDLEIHSSEDELSEANDLDPPNWQWQDEVEEPLEDIEKANDVAPTRWQEEPEEPEEPEEQ